MASESCQDCSVRPPGAILYCDFCTLWQVPWWAIQCGCGGHKFSRHEVNLIISSRQHWNPSVIRTSARIVGSLHVRSQDSVIHTFLSVLDYVRGSLLILACLPRAMVANGLEGTNIPQAPLSLAATCCMSSPSPPMGFWKVQILNAIIFPT